MGKACPGETPQTLASRRLTDRSREASAWSGNQRRENLEAFSHKNIFDKFI
jgi:hypothetical protein